MVAGGANGGSVGGSRLPPVVVLAAGAGSRLRDVSDSPKPLIRLLDRTLLGHAIDTCARAGITEVLVVVGYRGDAVAAELPRLAAEHGVTIEPVWNRHWQLGNGSSVAAAEPFVRGPFFLVMCDHLFPPEFLSRLHRQDDCGSGCSLVVDRNVEGVPDLDEATKVRLAGDRITAIGKGLTTFDAVDTGVFLARPVLFDALRRAGVQGDHSLSGAVGELAREGRASWTSSEGGYWRDVDTALDLHEGRVELLAQRAAAAAEEAGRSIPLAPYVGAGRGLRAQGVSGAYPVPPA